MIQIKFSLGIWEKPRKRITNFFKRLFKKEKPREDIYYSDECTIAKHLEVSVLVFSKDLEWIDTLYYGNKVTDDNNLGYGLYPDHVVIDDSHLSASYRYLVFIVYFEKPDDLLAEVRFSFSPSIFPELKYKLSDRKNWNIFGYLDMKDHKYHEEIYNLDSKTLRDVEKVVEEKIKSRTLL